MPDPFHINEDAAPHTIALRDPGQIGRLEINTSLLPDGITFDAATETITLDPTHSAFQALTSGQVLNIEIPYQFIFGGGLLPELKFPKSLTGTVTGTNDAPVSASDTLPDIPVSASTFVFRLNDGQFSDIDNDSLKYYGELTNGEPLPDGLTINEDTGSIEGTSVAPGTYSIRIHAYDPHEASTSLNVNLIVPTETDLPTEPTSPTAPTDPTTPTEPPEPTLPTEPTVPTEPTAPTEPTEPTGSTEPTTPTEPTVPTEPTAPTEPTEPTGSTEPTLPTEPTAPTEPTTPTEPTAPTEPTTPTTPSYPETPDNIRVLEDDPVLSISLIKPDMEHAYAVLSPEQIPTGFNFNPATGVLSIDPGHYVFQQLASGEIRDITIPYQIADDSNITDASVTFRITGRNDAPSVTFPVSTLRVNANDPAGYKFEPQPGQFQDLDRNDQITYSLRNPDGTSLPEWVSNFDSSTGSFEVDANSSHIGNHLLIIRAKDSRGVETETQIPVEITFDPLVPTAPTAPTEPPEPITISITEDSPIQTVDLIPENINGTVLINPSDLPAGFSFDSQQGKLTVNPAHHVFQDLYSGATRTIEIPFQLSRGGSITDNVVVYNVTGTNDKPTINFPISETTVNANDPRGLAFELSAHQITDIDAGDRLTYTLRTVDGTPLPNWIQNLDPETGSFHLTPSPSEIGRHEFILTATDTRGTSIDVTIPVTVNFEATTPTVPTEPTLPTEPTGPTEPTLPTQPTEPTSPTEPTLPTEPTEPTSPTEPTLPTEPTEPTSPTEPEFPEDPQNIQITEDGPTHTVSLIKPDQKAIVLIDPLDIPTGFFYEPDGNLLTIDPAHFVFQNLAAGTTKAIEIPFQTVENGQLEDHVFRYVITGVNDAPVINAPVELVTVNSNASDPYRFKLGEHQISDIDEGDVLTYILTTTDGSPLPTWIKNFDVTNGSFNVRPDPSDSGDHLFILTATDDRGVSTSTEIPIKVTFEPSIPTTPTEPTSPTGPTLPTQPTEPTGPTEPTLPTEPTEPTSPTEPTLPTEPTEPTSPTEPTLPTEPTEPTGPTELVPASTIIPGSQAGYRLIEQPKTGDDGIPEETAGFKNLVEEIHSDWDISIGADLQNVVLTGTADTRAWGSDTGNAIYGNAGNNIFYVVNGNNLVEGGAGHDTVVFNGPRMKYDIFYESGQAIVTDILSGTTTIVAGVQTIGFGGLENHDPLTGIAVFFDGEKPSGERLAELESKLEAGGTLDEITTELFNSEKFQSRLNTQSPEEIITDFYTMALGRHPEPEGLNYWVQRLEAGDVAQLALDIAHSDEFADNQVDLFATDQNDIASLYQLALNRGPDTSGFAYWNEKSADGLDFDSLADEFLSTDEVQDRFNSETPESIISSFYETGLKRAPDHEGFSFWLEQYENGTSIESIAKAFAQSEENHNNLDTLLHREDWVGTLLHPEDWFTA